MAPGAANIEISVIVPVRNGASTLPALLRSLQAQTLPPDRFEVLVVDNGSTDQTAGVAEAHGARVIREPVANRSRARNRGVAAASSDRYAFIDADCVARPGWLAALLEHEGDGDLVAGDVVLRTRSHPNPIERFEALWRFGQEAWVKQGWAATANLFVHARAFEAGGGFDPSWRHIGEDVDFCFRAKLGGFTLAYCPEAVVEHDGDRRLRPVLTRCFRHGYSVNQAFYRWDVGYRAWRDPAPALVGNRALRLFGHSPEHFDETEWRRMLWLAKLSYGARILGSAWAEIVRAR